MAARLTGPRLKLDRAEEHLNRLQELIDGFLAANHYGIQGEFVEQMNAVVIRAIVTRPTDLYWSSLIGDFAHNVRASLDQTISFFVRRHLGNTDRTAFPIFVDSREFSEPRKKLYLGILSANQSFLNAVIAEQPYMTRPNNPSSDTLAILADLNNTDKHQTIQTVGGAVGLESATAGFVSSSGAIGRMERHIITTRMKHNTPLALVYVEFLKQASVDIEFAGNFEITFDEGSHRANNLGVISTLKAIHDRVTRIVTKFESEFG